MKFLKCQGDGSLFDDPLANNRITSIFLGKTIKWANKKHSRDYKESVKLLEYLLRSRCFVKTVVRIEITSSIA